MYYPLLRARQFELIALREIALEGVSQGYIIPILEPVKESLNGLNLAFNIFEANDQTAYLIINPSVGEIAEDNDYYLNFYNQLDGQAFIPAFNYSDNADYINNCIDDFNLTNCLLICKNDINPDDQNFQNLVQRAEITSINVEDPGRNRALNRYLSNLDKTYIRLDDFFEKLPRNSDYLQIMEHRFSEEHLYYSDEGFDGFSDYTILTSEFSDGGSTPRAVVIHLTYLDPDNKIWIRHFTSVTNDSIANVQGKFAEAAQKAIIYCQENNLTNSAIQELEQYFEEQHYPGLGVVKKISIKNHLLVVHQFLSQN